MSFPKKHLFLQFHSMDLCTKYSVLFFEENWILKVKAVEKNFFSASLRYSKLKSLDKKKLLKFHR